MHFDSYLRGTPLHVGRQPSHTRSFAMAQEFVGLDETFLNEES
jgi:hypothetical protein